MSKGGWSLLWFEGSMEWLRRCMGLECPIASRYWMIESFMYFQELVSWVWRKAIQSSYLPKGGRCYVQLGLISKIRLIKVPQEYSLTESSELPMIDWICLFVHTLWQTLFIVLNYDIASLVISSLWEPFFVIETLTRSNYKEERRDIKLAFDLKDLDMCYWRLSFLHLLMIFLAGVDKWERSNNLSLTVMKRTISKTIFGGEFSEVVEQQFKELAIPVTNYYAWIGKEVKAKPRRGWPCDRKKE